MYKASFTDEPQKALLLNLLIPVNHLRAQQVKQDIADEPWGIHKLKRTYNPYKKSLKEAPQDFFMDFRSKRQKS